MTNVIQNIQMYQISNHDPRSHIFSMQFVKIKVAIFKYLLFLFAHLQKHALFLIRKQGHPCQQKFTEHRI